MAESEYLRRPDARPHLKVMECLRKWDPIGVFAVGSNWPQDEYDGYSGHIVTMLDAGVDAKSLAKHLRHLAEDNMGCRCDMAKTKAIAEELVDYWRNLMLSAHYEGLMNPSPQIRRQTVVNVLTLFSLIVGLGLDIAALLHTGYGGPFWYAAIVTLGPTLILLLLISLLDAPRSWRWDGCGVRSLLPVGVCLAALVLLVPAVAAGRLIRNVRFTINRPSYEAVVRMLGDDKIAIGSQPTPFELPREYASLAYTAYAEKDSNGLLSVVFYYGVGFPVKHAAYLYRSRGTFEEWDRARDWARWTRIDEHWYRISD